MRGAMLTAPAKRRALRIGTAVLCCGFVLLAFAATSEAKKRKFKRKECLDCHEEFVEEYFSMKNIHEVVEERKCEDCHLRHGIVGKLLLKEEGNDL